MKVVIATPLYPPEIGGPATYAEILVRELPKRGIEVELVKFSDVRHLPKIIRHFAYYRRVLKAARAADAVLALDPVSVGLPAMKAAKKLGKPYIVKIVGDYAWEQGIQRFGVTESLDAFVRMPRVPLQVRILRAIQTRVAESATRVIVPSEYLKYIVSVWGVDSKKISVIYNAVPMDIPGQLPQAIAELSRPLIVSVGRLVPWKGFEGLIDAVTTLREGGNRASLAIIGDGPNRESLKHYLQENLGTHGVYLGSLSHAETLATIKNADVFALNSSYEGLSHTLIEALSLGIPTVATRAGGNGEIVSDDKNGLLVPVGDTTHLAHAITCVIRDRALHERLGKEAKKSVTKFSESAMVLATVALLELL